MDTIRLRGPVPSRAFLASPRQSLVAEIEPSTGLLRDPRPTTSKLELSRGLRVEVKHLHGRPHASIEFSAPRRLRGDNCHPASPGEVIRAVAEAFDEAGEYVDWECGPEGLRVTRVDVARDFIDVADPGLLLDQLSRVPVAQRFGTEVIRTGDRSGVQTVYLKTDRWLVRVYHRGAMHLDIASKSRGVARSRERELGRREEGVVRYELQLRSRRLGELGLTRTGDLTTERLEEQSCEYFMVTGLGTTVGGFQAAMRLANIHAQQMSATEHRALGAAINQAVFDHAGMAPFSSPNTVRKHRATLARYRLPCGSPWDDSAARRLDLEAGTAVTVPWGAPAATAA